MAIEPIPILFSDGDETNNKNKNFSLKISTEFKDGRTYTIKTYTSKHGILWKIGQGIAAFFATLGTAVIGAFFLDSIKNLWLEAISGKSIYIIKEEETPQAEEVKGIFLKTHPTTQSTPQTETETFPAPSQPHTPIAQHSTSGQSSQTLLSSSFLAKQTPQTVQERPNQGSQTTNSISPPKKIKQEPSSNPQNSKKEVGLSKADAEQIITSVNSFWEKYAYGPAEIEFVQHLNKELLEIVDLFVHSKINFKDNLPEIEKFNEEHTMKIRDTGQPNFIKIQIGVEELIEEATDIIVKDYKDTNGNSPRLDMNNYRYFQCFEKLIETKFNSFFRSTPQGGGSTELLILRDRPVD